jgi:hypothetical protein
MQVCGLKRKFADLTAQMEGAICEVRHTGLMGAKQGTAGSYIKRSLVLRCYSWCYTSP